MIFNETCSPSLLARLLLLQHEAVVRTLRSLESLIRRLLEAYNMLDTFATHDTPMFHYASPDL